MPDHVPPSCLNTEGGGQLNKNIPIHVLDCNSSARLSHYINDYTYNLSSTTSSNNYYGFDCEIVNHAQGLYHEYNSKSKVDCSTTCT